MTNTRSWKKTRTTPNEDRFLILGLSSALGATAVLGAAKEMRREYDFSKARRNPYARRLKRQITIRLDAPTVEYFKRASQESGIPYQTLINLYLRDCAEQQRKLTIEWKASA